MSDSRIMKEELGGFGDFRPDVGTERPESLDYVRLLQNGKVTLYCRPGDTGGISQVPDILANLRADGVRQVAFPFLVLLCQGYPRIAATAHQVTEKLLQLSDQSR